MAFRSRRHERKPKEDIDEIVIISILCKWEIWITIVGSMRNIFPATDVMLIGRVKKHEQMRWIRKSATM